MHVQWLHNRKYASDNPECINLSMVNYHTYSYIGKTNPPRILLFLYICNPYFFVGRRGFTFEPRATIYFLNYFDIVKRLPFIRHLKPIVNITFKCGHVINIY